MSSRNDSRAGFRLDRFDLVALLVFAALAVWVLGLDLWQVVAHGRSWTGTDGVFLEDQMEYLSWIRSASQHLLASNLFVLQHTPADYFQPVIFVSGRIVSLGVAPWLVLLLWKPVCILAVFFSIRAFVYRIIEPVWERRAGLVLALFFSSLAAVVAVKLIGVGFTARLQWQVVTGDLWLGFWSWDYPFGLLGLSAMVAGLVGYDRARGGSSARWPAPVLGALAAALHPWQGGIFILLVLSGEALVWRRGERGTVRYAGVTIAATALPLLYYTILPRTDHAWKLAQVASSGSFPFGMVALTVAPLVPLALLAYRDLPVTFLSAATRAWPFAAVVVYFLAASSAGSASTHAFLGISVPLGVLAVEGARRIRWRERSSQRRVLVASAIVLVTVPGIWLEMNTAQGLVAPGPVRGTFNGPGDANFLDHGEPQALDYLAHDPRPGGVLARAYLGEVVPAITGRHTYVGNSYWSLSRSAGTIEFFKRIASTDALFNGRMTPAAARAFVTSTGARFLLADCHAPADLRPALGSLVSSTRRFGCATVYALG